MLYPCRSKHGLSVLLVKKSGTMYMTMCTYTLHICRPIIVPHALGPPSKTLSWTMSLTDASWNKESWQPGKPQAPRELRTCREYIMEVFDE